MKKILFILLCVVLLAALGAAFYARATMPRREIARARRALPVIVDLRRQADDYLKETGKRPTEMLKIQAPVRSTRYFIFQFNDNGSNAYRAPMYEKYRLHAIYQEYHASALRGRIICDVYDMDYDYICRALGGKFYENNADVYALKRYILADEK